ncbi:Molybdenum cofactor sulfurase [Aduncisulcus paluster]|uniref:Molybdenum cofactor sulfurase n=1 Tax=Aduncisulcus paluster TaxID=2918883 RepID=A0ABQ5KWB6_9EUKA|nr:Molybdenum cofactor sulfurase [Aduncisulcus paluster]
MISHQNLFDHKSNKRNTIKRFCLVFAIIIGIVVLSVSITSHIAYKRFLNKYFGYGYDGMIERLIHKEMSHLKGEVYLDYTGSGLYTKSQIDSCDKMLKSNLYCNAHSRAPCSLRTEKEIDAARKMVLEFFNTTSSEYSVIFTSGTTQGLKMIGEYFPWSEKSAFVYTTHNHNSVLGVRKYAQHNGGLFKAFEQSEIESALEPYITENDDIEEPLSSSPGNFDSWDDFTSDKEIKISNLFAYPAECNFSGIKYPLEWVNMIEDGSMKKALSDLLVVEDEIDRQNDDWYTILDVAAFVPTNKLDLSQVPADFVVLSFYKMFGYPTGLGALLIRQDVASRLKKPYFGGGSVGIVGCREDFCQEKPRPSDRLEDGTVGFLNIIALKEGFKLLSETLGGIEKVEQHVAAVTRYAYDQLSLLYHDNGIPLVQIYGNHEIQWTKYQDMTSNNSISLDIQGGILSFSVLNPDGSFVGYYTVQDLSARHNIHLRTGMVCNPGACYSLLGLNETQVCEFASNKESCGDDVDMMNGLPLGTVRVSFGFASTKDDVDALVRFLISEFQNSLTVPFE